MLFYASKLRQRLYDVSCSLKLSLNLELSDPLLSRQNNTILASLRRLGMTNIHNKLFKTQCPLITIFIKH